MRMVKLADGMRLFESEASQREREDGGEDCGDTTCG